MIRETLDTAGRVTRQGANKVSEAMLLRLLLRRERKNTAQEALSHCIGRVAIIGDFSGETDGRARLAVARHTARILLANDVIERGSPVEVWTMVPDTTIEGQYNRLSQSAESLVVALKAWKGVEPHPHPDPIRVTMNGGSPSEHVFDSIGGVITPEYEEQPNKAAVIVANPFFVSKVLPALMYHNLKEGGAAVLDETGMRTHPQTFVQLWSD